MRFKAIQFAAVLAVPSAALAQIGGGHSGISTENHFSGRIAFDELNAFGQCYAGRQTADALKLVATEPGSVAEARVYKALFSKDQLCLGDLSGLNVPWQYVRGAIAEGFYDRRYPVPSNLAAPHSLPREKVTTVMEIAICYAGQHPADARALVETTKPATKQESDAMDAQMPNLVACLPPNMPAGFKVDTLLLRYRIAEALWRLGWGHS